MTGSIHPPLRSFVPFVQATDEHAASRLALLERADRLLAHGREAGLEDRRALAEKLERWRYQHLSRRGFELTAEERGLADALDLAANALAGRGPRAPRWARGAIEDTTLDPGPIAEALDCLNPQVDLEEISRRAIALTGEYFGMRDSGASRQRWRVLLYAPLYLSNYCINHCTYCGFRHPNAIQREHLTPERALREAEVLRARGFRHILLVAGDFPSLTTTAYYVEILRALKARGIAPGIEIAPQSTDAYAAMVEAGACGVTLYQETYVQSLYPQYHPRGTKAAFDWRLEGLERAAEAGMARLGLGFLLGLADPREEFVRMLRHARYLADRFPDRTLAFSLPRIHDAPAGFRIPFSVDDETFLRMYCALRIAFPGAELVLSTREPAALRNRLAGLCITQLSAGSCTSPGGYEEGEPKAGEQFPVCDQRSPADVERWLREAGFHPVWECPSR